MTEVAEKPQTPYENPRRVVDNSGFVKAWKAFVADNVSEKSLTSEHYAFYVALKGKDWTKSFSPIRNENKLTNGMMPYQSMITVMGNLLSLERWDDIRLGNLARKKGVSPSDITPEEFYSHSRVASLLSPFAGEITVEDFRKVLIIMEQDYKVHMMGVAKGSTH